MSDDTQILPVVSPEPEPASNTKQVIAVKKNVAKVIFKRAWNDIEPKLAAALTSGALASALISEAAVLGYPLDPGVASLLTLACTVIAGYIKPSTEKTSFEGSPKN